MRGTMIPLRYLPLRIFLGAFLLLNTVALLAPSTLSQTSLLAPTPPMGWNSWNKFGCNVSDKLIREMAEAMVSSGMQAAGYQYVNIDDCWQVSRDAQGTIVADPQRFPSGMKALADHVHGKGLKLGLYTDAGTGTCEKRPGSLNHERSEEHTSELQSQSNLVCRLLLEKKNTSCAASPPRACPISSARRTWRLRMLGAFSACRSGSLSTSRKTLWPPFILTLDSPLTSPP